MPLPPKWQFRLNRWRNKLENVKGEVRQTEQVLGAEMKMCPSCRAFVPRGKAQCPYCDQRLQVWGTGPVGKVAKRVAPSVPVTAVLILVNLILFVLEYAVGGTSLMGNLFASPSQAAMLRLGASLPMPYIAATGQYWRWITACFLHAGILHIGMNMWALYVIGPLVESFYGGAKFLFLYIATGVIGYAACSMFTPSLALGASGAIFGLLGVMLAYAVRRGNSPQGQQLRGVAMSWVIFALVLSFLPGVAWMAHLGGLASGFGLAMILDDDPPMTPSQIRLWRVVQLLVVVVVAAAFVVMAKSPMLLG